MAITLISLAAIMASISGMINSHSIRHLSQASIIQLMLIDDVMARQRVQKIRNDDLEARIVKLEKK